MAYILQDSRDIHAPQHSPLVHVLASVQQHTAAMSSSPFTSLITRRTRDTPPFWWKTVNLSPNQGSEGRGWGTGLEQNGRQPCVVQLDKQA